MTHSDCTGGDSPEMSGDRDSSLLQQNGGGEVALRKGPWTKEEDEILLKFVKEKGIVKWTSIGKQTGLARSGKSCRLRWLNHLRPNLKKGSFTKEEENLIVRLHSEYGNKWTRIASKLPGRTDNEIKNFWNTRVKKCQKRQLPLYPETTMEEDHSPVVDANYHYNPRFYINNLDKKFTTKTDFEQILQSSSNAPSETHASSLHRLSSVSPHSWSLQQLSSLAYRPTQSFHSPSFESSCEQHSLSPPLQATSIPQHFPSQNQSIPTNQPTQFFLQQPPSSPGYISSLQQSRPSYQSMQALLSSPAMPPPTWLSSLQKDNGSSLAKQTSISHSTHPPIKPLMCASTPHQYSFMPSLDNKQFRRFKRPGGRLPRPLSAPLMSSTPTSKEPFRFTYELKSSNHSSSFFPLDINSTTQTSTTPTYQLNFPTVGLSDSFLQESPLSLDMTWPSISRSLNEPISPSTSFISKMEPPSIQSFSAAGLKYPSDTSLSQLNSQSMASFDLLDAQLQEELAIRDSQSSRKDEFFSQNLTRESLLTECIKTEDSLDNILSKENLPNEISQAEFLLDKYSIKDDILTQSFKTTDSSGSSLNTENSSYKSRRRKEFMNISKEKNGIRTQVTRKEDIFDETSKPTYLQDGSSRTDNRITEKLEGIWAGESSERETLPTRLDINKEGSKNYDLLVKDTRRKDFLDTGLTEDWPSERSDFTESLKMEDSLVIESFNVGGEFKQEIKKDLLEEGSRREGLLIESSSKDELLIGESLCKGDQLVKLSERHDETDASMSKDISLKENSGKKNLLTSNEQYPVVDEADLASSQRNTLFLLESGGQDINSSSIKHSAEHIEAEDHIDTEISSLLEFFPMAAEIPEWYNTSKEISSNKTAL